MDSIPSTSSNSIHYQFTTLILLLICRGISGATFTLTNRCDHIVWPGILANAGSIRLDSTGFKLPPGGSRSFQVPPGWSGRFWGRTGCTFEEASSGQGSCATGDCGSSQMECNGAGATPPATLAEFTIGSGTTSSIQDFYDVSLVDGYNLAMSVQTSGGSGDCSTTGCVTDLNRSCPRELQAGNNQACKSACEAFRSPEYCCSGAYGTPDKCKPSVYSEMFKSACPKSYSYAYDDATSTFTCTGADYTITFCPSSSSQKSSRDSSNPAPTSTSGTTNATPITSYTGYGSGSQSQENPTSVSGSWLPSFSIGDAWTPTSNFFVQIIVSLTVFLVLIVLGI